MSIRRVPNSLAFIPGLTSDRQHSVDSVNMVCRNGKVSGGITSKAGLIGYYEMTDGNNMVQGAGDGTGVTILSNPIPAPGSVLPDGTQIHTVLDLSGSGNNLVAMGTAPVTGNSSGFQGLIFSGVDQVNVRAMSVTGTYTGFSTYLVLKNLSPSTSGLTTWSVGTSVDPTTGNNGYSIRQDGSSNWDVDARSGDYQKGGPIPANPHILSAIHDFANETLAVTISGTTTTDSGTSTTSASPTRFCLGGRVDVDTGCGNIIAACAVIFGRALTAAEDAQVIAELQALYGVS
jgi:hypothetical protein